MNRYQLAAFFLLIGMVLVGAVDAQAGYLDGITAELVTIEDDVRTGVMPGIAGILLAMVTIAVGVAVVGYFTRGR